MRDIRGTAFLAHDASECEFDSVTLPSFADVCDSKRFYADATRIEYAEHDPVRGRALIQEHDGRYLIVNPRRCRWRQRELDRVAELPYTSSITRCTSRSAAFRPSRRSSSRSYTTAAASAAATSARLRSTRAEWSRAAATKASSARSRRSRNSPISRGYINDVGGPSANFRHHSCKKAGGGMCADRRCLAPTPRPELFIAIT